jgi:hypothetical protein
VPVIYQIAIEIQPLGRDVSKNPFSVVFARNALADPMVLSALLYHANVHLNSRSLATHFHQGETIRQLTLRLDGSTEPASDNIIGTVGLLAATGVSMKQETTHIISTLTVCGICRISLETLVENFSIGMHCKKWST